VCRTGERIAFNYLISQKYTGEFAQIDVLREGREVALHVPLDKPHALVPLHLNGQQPSYLVVAGEMLLQDPPLAAQSTVLSTRHASSCAVGDMHTA
jgi:hypothetical protein